MSKVSFALWINSSYLDFPALYNQSCGKTGDYLCDDAWACTANVNPDLVKRFGAKTLAPANGATGHLSATCAWIPFDMPQFTILTKADWQGYVNLPAPDDKVAAKGYCALTSSPNPRYVPGHCKAVAGNSGYNTPNPVPGPYVQGINTYTNKIKPPYQAPQYVYAYGSVNPPKADNPVSMNAASSLLTNGFHLLSCLCIILSYHYVSACLISRMDFGI